jgi:OOP family OmpA-OmpF porin
MNSFKYLVGAAALTLATSALAGGPEIAPVADSGFYLSGDWGLNFLSDASPFYTAGWNASGAVGYHFSQFRIEAEGAYLTHDARSPLQNLYFPLVGSVNVNPLKIVTAMANAYYDFNFGSNFIPYVGAGIGWGHGWSQVFVSNNPFGLGNFSRSFDRDSFAYQGVLGLDYKISTSLRVGLSYHALGLSGNQTINYVTNNNNSVKNTNNVVISRGFVNSSNFESKLNLGLSYFF